MTAVRIWLALVTFERSCEPNDVLPDHAQGASGWMVALAQSEMDARLKIEADLRALYLRVLEFEGLREIFDNGEVEEVDDHLALNLRQIEADKLTVWGTIHCYIGDGEA